MPFETPEELAEEFKKSPEFDRMRKELFAQVHGSNNLKAFLDRVDEIGRQKLMEPRMQLIPAERVQKELKEELDRYPILERAIGDNSVLQDPVFASQIRGSLQQMFERDTDVPQTSTIPQTEATSTATPRDEAPAVSPALPSSDDQNLETAAVSLSESSVVPHENGHEINGASGSVSTIGTDLQDTVMIDASAAAVPDGHPSESPVAARDEALELSSLNMQPGVQLSTADEEEAGVSPSRTRASSPLSEELQEELMTE